MSGLVHTRKAMIALAIMIAVVAVVVPTCRMVGCSMSVGSTMPWGHQPMTGLFGDCGGEYVVNGVPMAIVPAGADTLTVAALSAVFAALALYVPRATTGPLHFMDTAAPPLQADPRGMRLRL